MDSVRKHLVAHRGSCEVVAAAWLLACSEARRAVDADAFLLPPEALASADAFQQVGWHEVADVQFSRVPGHALRGGFR